MRAIIDLGSNSIKSLLVEDGKILYESSTVGRLVEAREKSLLSQASITRNLQLLQVQISILRAKGATSIDVYATQALREAENKSLLIDALEATTGICIKILDKELEAYYSYLAATKALTPDDMACVFDIGGASLEISYPDQDRELIRHSFPLGAMSLAQDFLPHLPVLPGAVDALRSHLKSSLPALPHRELIGVGGSLCILAALKLGSYDEANINGYLLSLSELDSQIDLLLRLDKEQTARLPGMQAGREDSILTGAIICQSLMHATQADTLRISTRGWRHHLAGIQ